MARKFPKNMISQMNAALEESKIFHKYWNKFKLNFKQNKFIDPSLELLEIYE